MAYLVTNTSANLITFGSGIVVKPGETRPITEIGSRELDFQRLGLIAIARAPKPDNYQDDARYVEVINDVLSTSTTLPVTVNILNLPIPLANYWYLVSPRIPGLSGWKLQLRRATTPVAYDYKYSSSDTAPFMTCVEGEAIFADADFPELYVRSSVADQVLEFEYWLKS